MRCPTYFPFDVPWLRLAITLPTVAALPSLAGSWSSSPANSRSGASVVAMMTNGGAHQRIATCQPSRKQCAIGKDDTNNAPVGCCLYSQVRQSPASWVIVRRQFNRPSCRRSASAGHDARCATSTINTVTFSRTLLWPLQARACKWHSSIRSRGDVTIFYALTGKAIYRAVRRHDVQARESGAAVDFQRVSA